MGLHDPKGVGRVGPKEASRVACHVGPLDPFKFHFLPFTFYRMSNVYNTSLNNYVVANLMGKKVN